MEYYIAIIQKEILPLLTAWMDFEDITLSEKKKKRERERTDWWLPEENGESWENRLSESKHKEEKQN